MLPGMELMACQGLAVPTEVMHHVVRVESSYNPYAIGVVGGRLVRQPRNLPEALATVRMLEGRGFNFSIGLAQVNRYNLDKYGLDSYEKAFEPCANLTAGSKILAECYRRANGDWGKSFSCYYSGNFSTGYRHGYVQKIYASIRQGRAVEADPAAPAIEVVGRAARRSVPVSRHPLYDGAAPAADAPPMASAAASPPPRRDRVSARIAAPTSRIESSVREPAPPAIAATPPPEALAAPVPDSMPAQVAIARAVPASSQVGIARAVVAESLPTPEPQPAKRRDRTSDKAFVASDSDQDDAFVF